MAYLGAIASNPELAVVAGAPSGLEGSEPGPDVHRNDESGETQRASEPVRRRGRPIAWRQGLLVLAPLAVLAVLYVFEIPICPARNLFGVPCPGCGMTRASVALVTLDFDRALTMHPLVPVILPVVVYSVARAVLRSARVIDPGPGLLERIPRHFATVLLLALLGVWVVRLAGGFGGPPDPVDPASGLLGRAVGWLS